MMILGCTVTLSQFMATALNERYGIDMNCVGTAAGIIATCQLLAAVAIPTFILTPIAGTNYSLLFTMASGLMLVMGVLGLLFPDFKDKTA